MERTLIDRDGLCKRWGVVYRTIINYEDEGIITRNPNFKKPMYYIEEIIKIESMGEVNPLSPLERRKLVNENKELREEINILKNTLVKVVNIGTESMNILSNVN